MRYYLETVGPLGKPLSCILSERPRTKDNDTKTHPIGWPSAPIIRLVELKGDLEEKSLDELIAYFNPGELQ